MKAFDFNTQQMPALLTPDTFSVVTGDSKNKTVLMVNFVDLECKVVKSLLRDYVK